MSNNRKSFLVYASFFEATEHLSDVDFGQLWKAVFAYQATGEIVKMSPSIALGFNFIKIQLDNDSEKYSEIIEARKAGGLLGGRPSKNNRDNNRKNKDNRKNNLKVLKAQKTPEKTPEKTLDDVDDDVDDIHKKDSLSSSPSEQEAARDDDEKKINSQKKPHDSPPTPPNTKRVTLPQSVKPPDAAEHKQPTYHQTEFHPLFAEVCKYITDRLPRLNRKGAAEVNRWLIEGVDPPDIYQTVDYCISVSSQPIYTFNYFTDAVMSTVRLKKELAEQEERMRKKYAESK